jgi:hypothetical protein
MSKKQAKKIKHSPGKVYHTPEAKPMSRKAKIILCICAAVLLLTGIWFFFIHDNGYLPVKGGVVQVTGDDWLIVNYGTASKPKYLKIATVGPVEGYTRDTNANYKTDKNTTDFILRPDDPLSGIKYCYVTGIAKSATNAAADASNDLASQLGKEGISERASGTLGGYQAEYFFTKSSSANESGVTQYMQMLNCYLAHDNTSCVLFNVTVTADDPGKYLDNDKLLQIADAGAASVTFVNSK